MPKGTIQEQLLDMWQAEMYVTASVANAYTVRCMGVSVEKMERQVRMLLQLAEHGSVGAVLRRLRARNVTILQDEAVAQLALHTCNALAHLHCVLGHAHQCAPLLPSIG